MEEPSSSSSSSDGEESSEWCVSQDEEEEEENSSSSSSSGSSSEDEKKPVKPKSYPCYVCGKSLTKPSLLEQHLRTHSKERPFSCPACPSTYKTDNHLQQHIQTSHGELEKTACTWPGCTYSTSNSIVMKRHLKRHEEKGKLQRHRDKSSDNPKPYVCHEENCGKAYKYPSQLKYHEERNHGQCFVDVVCSEPGCGEHFDHPSDLSQHTRSAHKYVFCEVCGKVCLRRNMKRHYQKHDESAEAEKTRIPCPYAGCSRSYLQEGNLRQHIKIIHLNIKPYICAHKGCERQFGFKKVRDRHEKSIHISGDFLAEDQNNEKKRKERKNKGGRPKKRKVIETVNDLFVQRQQQKRPKPKTRKTPASSVDADE